jgi:hypothetical protein
MEMEKGKRRGVQSMKGRTVCWQKEVDDDDGKKLGK